MAHVMKYKAFSTRYRWFDDVVVTMFKKQALRSFQYYVATKILQKYARGFITRRYKNKLNEAATVIQKHWRAYLIRIHAVRYSRIRFIEARERYYHDMAAVIQRAWRAYLMRKNPFNGTVKFFKNINAANERIVENMNDFHDYEYSRNNQELIVEKKKWLSFALPKLHHLIRTKMVPGVYSLKGTQDYSLVENLLAGYDFSNFTHDLNLERKKYIESYQGIEPEYQLEKRLKKCEKAYKERNVLKEPKL